jgi:PBP1b-binding outer membrane lipoprotein LpoB
MKRIFSIILISVFLISCSSSEKKASDEPPVVPAATTQDTTKYPEKPEGYKSPHQEQSEEHKDEPSRIK